MQRVQGESSDSGSSALDALRAHTASSPPPRSSSSFLSGAAAAAAARRVDSYSGSSVSYAGTLGNHHHHHHRSSSSNDNSEYISSAADVAHTTSAGTRANNNNNYKNAGVATTTMWSPLHTPMLSHMHDRTASASYEAAATAMMAAAAAAGAATATTTTMAAPVWRKVLYERQPFEDNYVDFSQFNTEMRKNANVRSYRYREVVQGTLVFTQHITIAILFVVVFAYVLVGHLSARSLVCLDTATLLVMWLLYECLRPRDGVDDYLGGSGNGSIYLYSNRNSVHNTTAAAATTAMTTKRADVPPPLAMTAASIAGASNVLHTPRIVAGGGSNNNSNTTTAAAHARTASSASPPPISLAATSASSSLSTAAAAAAATPSSISRHVVHQRYYSSSSSHSRDVSWTTAALAAASPSSTSPLRGTTVTTTTTTTLATPAAAATTGGVTLSTRVVAIVRTLVRAPATLCAMTDPSVLSLVSQLALLTPLLRTLTLTYSDDTIVALSIMTMFVHVLTADYNYLNAYTRKYQPNLSVNAATFGVVLMASRLSRSLESGALIAFGAICFSISPLARHALRRASLAAHVLLTLLLFAVAAVCLRPIPVLVVLFVSGGVLVTFVIPFLFLRLHGRKEQINGPWDEAKPTNSAAAAEWANAGLFR